MAAVGVGMLGASILPSEAASVAKGPSRSRVVLVDAPNLLVSPDLNKHPLASVKMTSVGQVNRSVDQAVLNSMMSTGMRALTGAKTDADAWKKLFKPTDVVGVKVNSSGGADLSTHPEVVASIIAGLKLAGVKEQNIIVWDRWDGELIVAGYKINRAATGVKCYGTGDEYEADSTHQGAIHARLSKILTQKITALISVPVLKEHGLAGITAAMKNHYGSFYDPGRYHANSCDPYVADLNAIPAIKNKTRLIVLDSIRATCNAGPSPKPEFVWTPKSLMLSTDPVALDYEAWQIIEARRKETALPSLTDAGHPPKHISTAASAGLGTDDPSRIDLVRKHVG